MKTVFAILIFNIIVFSGQVFSQSEPKDIFVAQFMNAMKSGSDLKPYVIYNGSLPLEYEINFFSVDKFQVLKEGEDDYRVIIDTGIGKSCVSIIIRIQENADGKLGVLPGKVKYLKILKKEFVNPWQKKEKIC